jgi:hypothetical protein
MTVSHRDSGIASYALFGYWKEHSSKEMVGLFETPVPLLVIVGIYFWFVLSFGPRFMEKRKPYDLSAFIKLYNIGNVVVNGIFCLLTFVMTRGLYDCWGCKDNLTDPLQIKLATVAAYGYTMLKVADLLDTVFFILRKKFNQVTPLHVIHHGIMPLTSYAVSKIAFGLAPALVFGLNTFIHTIMYYYYHAASKGSPVWWKKYITAAQLIQFYIIFVHAIHTFFFDNCPYPRVIVILQLLESSYFIASFTRFYMITYSTKWCNNNLLRGKLLKRSDDNSKSQQNHT